MQPQLCFPGPVTSVPGPITSDLRAHPTHRKRPHPHPRCRRPAWPLPVVAGPSVPPSAHHATIPTAEHELSLLPLHSPITTPLHSHGLAIRGLPHTLSQVGTLAQLDAATESLTTTVPAAHAVIGAAKNKDVTSITEPVTV